MFDDFDLDSDADFVASVLAHESHANVSDESTDELQSTLHEIFDHHALHVDHHPCQDQLYHDIMHLPAPFAHTAASTSSSGLQHNNLVRNYTYEEALIHGPDNEKSYWIDALDYEIKALDHKQAFVEIPIAEAHGQILPTLWVLVKKFFPDGTFKKFRARLVIRGDLMQNPKSETFSPVAHWSTVRILLVFAMINDWYACTKDLLSAFLHARLPEGVSLFAHLPRGYHSTLPGKSCLRLLKSIYGTTTAPRLFFDHLRRGIIRQKFHQSLMDSCLFIKQDIMVLIYVDDLLIVSKSSALVTQFLDGLKEDGFEIDDDSKLTEYLGIKLQRSSDSIIMTQPGLINKLLAYTNMEDCHANHVPADIEPLSTDKDGEPFNEPWSYPRVVGMLLYLSTNTRADIAFAVSQVCRFTSNPKKSHGQALKRILRYLKGTKDRGTIFHPSKTLDLECYVDSDFAARWKDPIDDPASARSRTGYTMTLTGCPLLHCSRLQTRTATSTLMAEYYALSTAMRALLPIRNVILEILEHAHLDLPHDTIFHSRIFCDNNGALTLAREQRLTPRTRYFTVDVHFFWEAVRDNHVEVLRTDSADNCADGFTKGLRRSSFEQWRHNLLGW